MRGSLLIQLKRLVSWNLQNTFTCKAKCHWRWSGAIHRKLWRFVFSLLFSLSSLAFKTSERFPAMPVSQHCQCYNVTSCCSGNVTLSQCASVTALPEQRFLQIYPKQSRIYWESQKLIIWRWTEVFNQELNAEWFRLTWKWRKSVCSLSRRDILCWHPSSYFLTQTTQTTASLASFGTMVKGWRDPSFFWSDRSVLFQISIHQGQPKYK